MSIFSIFERRNKTKETEIQKDNPCNNMSEALSNLLKKFGKVDAMSISAFFCGVNIITNSIALMKWVFKDEDNEELPFSHYLNHIFDNSKLTRFNIIKNIIRDIILYGNGFLYIERDRETGKPINVEYSPAEDTIILYDGEKYNMYFMNPKFSNKWDNGESYCHFYMNTSDGFQGKSIKDYAYRTIKLSGETEKAASDYYASGGQLFGLISLNGATPMVGTKEKQIESLKNSWDEARSKSSGTGCVFIPQDLKYTPLSSNAKDSNMIESRQFNVVEIARFLNINPILLGDLTHNVYGTLSEAQRDLILHTLKPYVVLIEEEVNRKLIMPSKFNKQHLDIDENSIQSIERAKLMEELTKGVTQGIISQNEARKELGLPPVEGGDKLVIAYSKVSDNQTDNNNDNADNKEKNQEE